MSEKTTYGYETEHGYDTEHSYPSTSVGTIDILKNLSTQFYPTGRAWYRPENGVFEKLHEAINLSFFRSINDGKLLIDSLFPDNDNFKSEDATLWEYRLGLLADESTSLELRKQAISRKMGYPNNVKSRQHESFIEKQLQLAGFNVWVHENLPPYQSPIDIAAVSLSNTLHGDPTQHGNATFHGGNSFSVIANSIDEFESYAIGGEQNLWATFFIGAEVLGETATVPASRLREFKELVIKLKPAHLVAFTFVNYI